MGLGPITVGITAEAGKFAQSAKAEVGRAIPVLELAGKELGGAISSGLTTAFVGLGAAVVASMAGAVYAIQSFTLQGIALADGLVDASAKLGIGATSLLAFQEVAKLTGVEMSTLEQALGKMNVKMGEAQLGNDAAIQSFSQLGLSVSALAAMAPEARFQAISNAINSIPDASIRAAMAVDVFGKTGMQLIPVFDQLGATSEMLAMRWDMLSANISEAQMQAAAGIADRIDMVGQTFDRFKILLASELAPLLDTILTWLDEMVISAGGLAPAAEVAGIWIEKLAGYIIDAGQLLQGVGYILVGFGEIAGNFSESWKFASENLTYFMEIAFGKIIVGIANVIDFSYTQFASFFNALPDMFEIAVIGIISAMGSVFRFIVKGLGNLYNVAYGYAAWSDPVLEKTQRPQVPLETEMGKNLRDYGKNLSAKASAELDVSLANNPTMKGIGDTFNKGIADFNAVLGGGDGRWSTAFMNDVAAQRAKEAAGPAGGYGGVAAGQVKLTNQQLIDQRNAWQSASMPQGGGGGVRGAGSNGTYLPSSTARNVGYSDYGRDSQSPPISINIASGVTAQQVRQAVHESVPYLTNAVQKKVKQGGDYRREIQC